LSTSFAAAETIYDAESLSFDGGWWYRENRERNLANLLFMADSYLVQTDKVRLYQFSKTSQETITNVELETFTPSRITRSKTDSVRVHWVKGPNTPQDLFLGQGIAPSYSGGTIVNPASKVFVCRFLAGQSENAQRAATLYAQKRYDQLARMSFSKPYIDLTNKATLNPGQVISINNTNYGGSFDVIITEMQFTREGDVRFGVVRLNHLEAWADQTPGAISVVEDDSEAFSPSPANIAWNFSGVFSSTDFDTVAWTSGTLQTPNSTYEIDAGDTGNMTAVTYIYFDPEASTTELQTTTDLKIPIKADRILMCVAEDYGTSGSEAVFQVFGGSGGAMWTGDNIVVNSIKAANIDTDDLFAQTITLKTDGVIQSDNYVEGSDGWQIDYEGDAEFNSAVIRNSFVEGYVNNNAIQLELMKVNFQSISWAQFAVYDAFADETKRQDPDPATNDAVVYQGTLIQGDATADKSFGFTSVEYEDITTIETGTSTDVGTDYLEDTAKEWYTDECKGLTLVDSASSEFEVVSNTSDTLTVSGNPAAGAYSLKDDLPGNAVMFCSYNDDTGEVKLEASFDGGSNYVTFLDTETSVNKLGGTVDISAVQGKDFIVRITIKNDGAGAGPEMYNFLLCTDPSPWRY